MLSFCPSHLVRQSESPKSIWRFPAPSTLWTPNGGNQCRYGFLLLLQLMKSLNPLMMMMQQQQEATNICSAAGLLYLNEVISLTLIISLSYTITKGIYIFLRTSLICVIVIIPSSYRFYIIVNWIWFSRKNRKASFPKILWLRFEYFLFTWGKFRRIILWGAWIASVSSVLLVEL